MNIFAILVIALYSSAKFVTSQDFPLPKCDIDINYPRVWKKYADQCMDASMGLEEKENFTKYGIVLPTPPPQDTLGAIPLTTLLVLKCTYDQMHDFFIGEPSIGVDKSLFYEYGIPQKIKGVVSPDNEIAFKINRFKTEDIGTKTVSPFHPQGGQATQKGNDIWKKCAAKWDQTFNYYLTGTQTITPATAQKASGLRLQLYPYGAFALCFQQSTTEYILNCTNSG